jgi:hypothetical protein
LERLERDPFLVSIRDHKVREGLKKEIKKFSQQRLCLLTCLLPGGNLPGNNLPGPTRSSAQ